MVPTNDAEGVVTASPSRRQPTLRKQASCLQPATRGHSIDEVWKKLLEGPFFRKEVIIHVLSEFDSFECAKALAH